MSPSIITNNFAETDQTRCHPVSSYSQWLVHVYRPCVLYMLGLKNLLRYKIHFKILECN